MGVCAWHGARLPGARCQYLSLAPPPWDACMGIREHVWYEHILCGHRYEVCQEIRRRYASISIPIIMVSAKGHPEHVMKVGWLLVVSGLWWLMADYGWLGMGGSWHGDGGGGGCCLCSALLADSVVLCAR